MRIIHDVAAESAPREACGLLFGGDAIDACTATPNVAADPSRHFEIDPGDLFAALRAERAGGRRLAGYWHSHPTGNAMPSATDAAMAAPDGKFWLIVGAGEFRLWKAEPTGFTAVEICVT